MEPRDATEADIGLVAGIAADGFVDDPVMTWLFPDEGLRKTRLLLMFGGLARDMLPDGGHVRVLEDVCASFWRDPGYEHVRTASERAEQSGGRSGGDAPPRPSPFRPDELERMDLMREHMAAAHPTEPHWYLNVLATRSTHQGAGLGGRLLAAGLARCDADAMPAYLESSNPRNMTLYRRHGFDQSGEITLADGPTLYPMWRPPRG